jgi:stress-induced morphogen
MTSEEVKRKIETGLPGAIAEVADLTGSGDHFRAEVRAPQFSGKSTMEMHRIVYAILGRDVGGPIHALTLVTKPA